MTQLTVTDKRSLSELPTSGGGQQLRRGAQSLRMPVAAIAATLTTAIALVFFTGGPEIAELSALERLPAISVREVFFEDVVDGSVRVTDAHNGAQIELIAPASNGFLRGAVRGLVRERKRQSIGAELPFTVAALASGRVVLRDTATAREIDLASFGSSNVEAFARLLPPSTSIATTKP
jgi:putative photosynthetic complex assembly protein